MHFQRWYILMYFIVYRLSIQRAMADGRFQFNLQLWEPPDFRPADLCCSTDVTSVPDNHGPRPNISVTSDSCTDKCVLYSDLCLATHYVEQQFDASRDCVVGRSISRLNHTLAWRNSSLSNIEFLILGRLPPVLTIILRILRSDSPSQSSNSWNLIFHTVFHESQPISSEKWTTVERELDSMSSILPNNVSEVHPDTIPVTPHLVLNYRFKCSRNFYGPECDRFCQPMRGLHGNFMCDPETGSQRCLPGWSGERCTDAICDPPCVFGSCVRPNYCKCRTGWQGKDCGQCQVYPGCVHGECERNSTDDSMVPLTCECQNGWGGMLCDIDLQYCQRHPQICQNGGLCVNTKSRDESFHRCVCPPQFYGRHCEQRATGCELDGCGVFGTCVRSVNDTYVCKCQAGHCGPSCQLNGSAECNQLDALNKLDLVNQTQEPMNYTEALMLPELAGCPGEQCLNGGLCQNFTCHCPTGFHGTLCQLRLFNETTYDPDEYQELALHQHTTSNETDAVVSLETATFMSNLYRSSMLLFLLAFILLLLTAILIHCIHSHQHQSHHRQQKPRYARSNELSYPHIANNLNNMNTNTGSADHDDRYQRKKDSWTINNNNDNATTTNSATTKTIPPNKWSPPSFAFDFAQTKNKWNSVSQKPLKLALGGTLTYGGPETYLFPARPVRTVTVKSVDDHSWLIPQTKSPLSKTFMIYTESADSDRSSSV